MVEWLLAAALAAPPPEVPCPSLGNEDTTTEVVEGRDAVLGPLVLLGAQRMANRRQDGFRNKGYKVPITLTAGVQATLSVPPSMRGRVGLVYRDRVQDAVWKRGVRAADTALRFTACEGEGRSGWAGGLVVDRRRCVTLVVTVEGSAPVRRRVPLGRPC